MRVFVAVLLGALGLVLLLAGWKGSGQNLLGVLTGGGKNATIGGGIGIGTSPITNAAPDPFNGGGSGGGGGLSHPQRDLTAGLAYPTARLGQIIPSPYGVFA